MKTLLLVCALYFQSDHKIHEVVVPDREEECDAPGLNGPEEIVQIRFRIDAGRMSTFKGKLGVVSQAEALGQQFAAGRHDD